MPIPTELVGSLPRPLKLQEAFQALDDGKIELAELQKLQDEAAEDSIKRLEQTGETYVTDGEQSESSFATYPITDTLAGTGLADNLAGDGQFFAIFDDGLGASPLVSSWFHDEPAVLAMNAMSFDVGTLGNHEFDEGGREMLRLIRGGHREDGLQFKTPPGTTQAQDTSDTHFPGADFPYVAANTRWRESGGYVLPPVKIVKRKGEKIGFIGVTTEDTPNIVLKSAIDPFLVDGISESVNRWVRYLERRNVETIVVLAHAGGFQTPAPVSGEIIREAREMDDAVDVIVAGHTHSLLNDLVPNAGGSGSKLVVSAFANGTAYDRVTLSIDRASNDVLGKSAIVPTTWNADTTPTADAQAVVDEYRDRIAPIAGRVLGTASADLRRDGTRTAPDSTLGSAIADAQRAKAGTQLALMNPGGIRDDVAAGEVTYGELFTVQPFDNQLLRFTITGAELEEVLLQQLFPLDATGRDRVLQISGFTYSLDRSDHTVPDLRLANGDPIGDTAEYTVAANEFIAGGGDGFTVLQAAASDKAFVSSDLDALVDAFVGRTVDLPARGRITAID